MGRKRKPSGEHHRVVEDEPNVDRLSALPDGVICHILSFLSTKISVQTSILAKRWRTLWSHVPLLSFNHSEYNSKKTKTKSFQGMVCSVMLRHKVQSLNTFSITYLEDDDDDDDGDDDDDDDDDSDDDEYHPKRCYEVETCVAVAVERNIQNLYLGLRFELPRCVMTCKTLVVLTMYDDVRIPSSGPISLPNLKKLDYYCINYEVDLTRLLSGCPVLEDLSFSGYPRSSCNISSPTLKRLSMVFLFGIDNHPEYLVNIIAPALRYLKVNHCSGKRISISLPASLVEADILLKTSLESVDLSPRCVLTYLDSFCNVKCLNISSEDAEFPDLDVAGRPYVRFGKLTKLQLTADWRLLTKFLQSANQLEVLIIHEVDKDQESWTEPMEERCACLHSLKTVTIYDFKCTEQDCKVVRFILRNAQVLKRMEICCKQRDLKKKFDALQSIALVHRGSRECELIFS